MILISAALILSVGAVYRNSIKEKAVVTISPEIERLSAEVRNLKSALKKSDLESIQELVVEVARKAMPAVVFITPKTEGEPPNSIITYTDYRAKDGEGAVSPNRSSESGASGVLIDAEGYILTTANIARSKRHFEVRLEGSISKPAQLIALDSDEQLALLKLDQTDPAVRPAAFVRTEKPKPGDWLVRLGRSPSGAESVSLGMVSLVRGGAEEREAFIMDTAMVPEQDGGPVINLQGEVAGISIYLPERRFDNRIVVPIDRALALVEKLKREIKSLPLSWIGIEVQELTPDLKRYFSVTKGALISGLSPGGPAFKAGLRRGDLLIRLDDLEIESAGRFIERVSRMPAGSKLRLAVKRKGAERVFEVETMPFAPEHEALRGEDGKSVVYDEAFGFLLARRPSQQGVEIKTVLPNSEAYRLGLRAGDLIAEINGMPVRSYRDFQRRRRAQGKDELQLWQIRRKERAFFIAVKVGGAAKSPASAGNAPAKLL